LLDRAKSGTYWAPPVRRAQTPKGDGKETRTLGIPTFEDKILQRAVAMVLEAVYERVFHEGSFGFRPGRCAHQALQATREPLMAMGGGWVVEVDIRRDHRQCGRASERAIPGLPRLAQMAEPTIPKGPHVLGPLQPTSCRVPAAQGAAHGSGLAIAQRSHRPRSRLPEIGTSGSVGVASGNRRFYPTSQCGNARVDP